MLNFHEKVKRLLKVDPLIMGLYVLLSVFGLVMVYSASSYYALVNQGNSEAFMVKQLLYIVLGVLLALGISILPEKWMKSEKVMGATFGVIFILLVVVLFTKGINGAKSWINLKVFNLQPSELVKLFVIWISAYLYSKNERSKRDWRFYLVPGGVTIFLFGMIMLQPDLGTGMIVVAVALLLGLMTGVSNRALASWGAVFALLYGITYLDASIFEKIGLKAYQVSRFTSFHNPWADARGSGYQSIQGFLGLSRGNWFGTGLSNSVQKTGFLPEAHTDFILAIVGEELGFVVIFVLMLAIVGFIIAMIYKGNKCRSLFAKYLCYGVAILFLIQSGINIGALVGFAPLTGVPLPLISYGGSSFLASSVGVGFVLWATRNDQKEKEPTPSKEEATLEEEQKPIELKAM
ncbi:FtsW/RodA/SpoVE family cell cycle protein [uncultured Granulicatella sp.]|uniref:FtsW/RodA/SpoVE family cell cycle protein n=1 Tax=uncultured Granulicatella sp. TaxID=316089 RepID=UPI0026068219|nr:putative peptidoglycan glycosyltransferase FtsW [uncultured Granulicatella sp.]